MGSISRLVGLVVTLFSLTGCIGLISPAVPEPEAHGTYAVGVTTMTVQDASRDRELPVEVWYPAASAPSGSDDDPVIYSVRAIGGTVARLRSPLGAHRDVDAKKDGGPYPVVLLSHGAGSTRLGNVTLSEVLASHGYIVAAPDHPGHTIDDQVLGISDTQRAQAMLDRPLDLSRVLDALAQRSRDPRFVLGGLVDMDRVAVAGHSFGSAAALALVGARFDAPRQEKECEKDDDDRRCAMVDILGPEPYRYRDPRISAAILISPAGFDLYRADGIGWVDAPTLVVGAVRDETNKYSEYAKPTYDALKSPHYLLRLRDAGHLTATDVCEIGDSIGFMSKTFGGKKAVDGCGGPEEGFISSRVANDLAARAALAFLDVHLNHDTSAEQALQIELTPTVDSIQP
ncbi:MAG: alpha/beta fold hydrolase [Polyangiaceae bacterium]|nr:alpha/beta fold hydrolase [Polyangiaceae bacterium]